MDMKAVLKNVLLLANVVGVVVGTCVLLCYLVLVTVRRALGVPFSFSAVDQLQHFLLVGGALLLVISLVGYCALLKADCAGKWLLIPYIIALSVITGIQIYILVVLFMNKNAVADDVTSYAESASKLRETMGRFRDTVAPSKLPDSNIITIFTTPKGTHKERVKRQLSLFDQAYERIKGDKNNETKVLDPANNTETETLSPINKQHENVKDFIGFTKSNLQLIRNKSLETRFFNLTRAASKARREYEDMVTQMRRATNTYNMKLALSNSRKFAENAWRDQNKYIDLLKPILGNSSRPILTISKSSPVLKIRTGVVIFQILYFIMVLIFTVLKDKSEDTK